MVNIFPSNTALPGQGWSVFKTPNWGTRMQRAVSGRELRTQDFINPIWNFKLTYGILRDKWDIRAGILNGQGLGTFGGLPFTPPMNMPFNPVGYDELRIVMGFFGAQQGATIPFYFNDPSDDSIVGQLLPQAISSIAPGWGIPGTGSGYNVGDLVYLSGGTFTTPVTWQVNSSPSFLTLVNPGSYTVVPGTANLSTTTNGCGSGILINAVWLTTVQLVRTMSTFGFTETIVAPNTVSNLYYNGVSQSGWASLGLGGLVQLPQPFFVSQPAITADFTYYFYVRFTKDQYEFENFMYQLWQLKEIELTSLIYP